MTVTRAISSPGNHLETPAKNFSVMGAGVNFQAGKSGNPDRMAEVITCRFAFDFIGSGPDNVFLQIEQATTERRSFAILRYLLGGLNRYIS
jgi:hypothetical protein